MRVRNKTSRYVYNFSMKAIVFIFLFMVNQACAAHAIETGPDSETTKTVVKQTLLVELFTSEGCSSCPPAEELLARFESEQPFADAELVTLAFHVDYWDDLGWKDKYASPLFTQRQRVYDRKFRTGQIYTPQMVVDGDIEFIGSREKDARKAIKKSVRNKKAKIELDLDGLELSISITEIPEHGDSSIYVALAEDGLSSNIKKGENAGRNLEHVSVVRELRGIGRIAAANSRFDGTITLIPRTDWNPDNVKVIVFVQDNASRVIHGVSRVPLRVPVKGEDG